ncbi:hypothetical protein COO91_02904 [Nostoc flagelliforme CCNUN1]|uniref:Uncharacterized protein n=1 Tax=Nostoc flagelliforme CCNUN1 TaxID=2038116 RepID=A0A2K8SQ95_9NOSO|nr:hypothetical protein COO91_02904 [Nostoc flagelliforme CCNUN1]
MPVTISAFATSIVARERTTPEIAADPNFIKLFIFDSLYIKQIAS